MPEAIQYVRELADRIGPRPATTDAEAEAADYLQDVFRSRGLDVERQEFECPRTYSWSYVLYHLLTIGSAVAWYWPVLRWPAFALAAITGFLLYGDLETRWGLSRLMPKGPSQNIIARRVPKARRNERPVRIVIVAHYDSARSSLAFSPGMVKNFAFTFGLMKWCTWLTPLLLLAGALPYTKAVQPYLWYVTLVVAGYLLIPLLINAHREIFMSPVDGAGDNASGVAAMLGVMEAVIPEPEGGVSMPTQPLRTSMLWDDSLDSNPVSVSSRGRDISAEEAPTELPDDFRWAETPARPAQQGRLSLDTVEFEPVGGGRGAAAGGSWGEIDTDFDGDGVPDSLEGPSGAEPIETSDAQAELFAGGEPEAPRKGLFGKGKRIKASDADVSGWLGVDSGFDARHEGRKIGSWDNFEEEDEFGEKGGAAGGDFLGDPEFAADEAARIRRRVTESVDRSIAEKEIWFVATGAEEVGTYGMQALLKQYADDLKSALIINIDGVGSGKLYWVTGEGMARIYRSTPRLVSTAKRVARELELPVTGRQYKALSTDATPALARGFKAMSVMAFDINGRIPNWHWKTDTADTIDAEVLDRAVQFVTGLVREL